MFFTAKSIFLALKFNKNYHHISIIFDKIIKKRLKPGRQIGYHDGKNNGISCRMYIKKSAGRDATAMPSGRKKNV